MNSIRKVPLFDDLLGQPKRFMHKQVREVHQQHTRTIVTPGVYEVAEKLFPHRHLLCVGDQRMAVEADREQEDATSSYPTHDLTMVAEWIYPEGDDDPETYTGVTIDGELYLVCTP